MSFILTKNAGVPVKYLIEGYVETAADLVTFRTDFTLGSKVITIDEGKEYILTEEGWTYLHDVTVEEINKLKAEIQSLSKLKNWLGDTTTPLYDGSTANPIIINGEDVTAQPGDVARYNGDQFIFSDAGTWQPYDDQLDVYTKDEIDAFLAGKVDKIEGKGLSTNDFTNEYKNKVDGALPKSGGQLTGDVTSTNEVFTNKSFVTKEWVENNTSAAAIVDVTTLPIGSAIEDVVYRLATTSGNTTTYTYYLGDSTNQTTTQIPDKAYVDNGFVAKISGKGLSTNDYTTAEKNKLAGIATQANKVTISTGSTDGTIAVSINGGTAQDVTVRGLGSAAFTDSSIYADAEEYAALLESYNDLVQRLNIFLINTGGLGVDYLVTVPLDDITLTIHNERRSANTEYLIDWGDGSTDIYSNLAIQHTYDERKSYKIKITPLTDSAWGYLSLEDLDNNIIEFRLEELGLDGVIEDNTTLQKIIVDNLLFYFGSSTFSFIDNASALQELHIKENCGFITGSDVASSIAIDCSALTKAIVDIPLSNPYLTLFTNCPNLTELHLTSTTVPTEGALFDTIPTGLTIYVPAALLDEYKAALSDYASYMVGE